jgi:adenylosuccinate lyase
MPQASEKASWNLSELTAISPLDGRYRKDVCELAPHASEMALIQTRVEVEARYLIALSEVGVVRKLTDAEHDRLMDLGPTMSVDQVRRVKEIEKETRHDVKAVEREIREMVAGTSLEDVTEMIHFGLTSEDVNNLSYRLMLDRARKVLIPVMDSVVDGLVVKAALHRDTPMLARTHLNRRA